MRYKLETMTSDDVVQHLFLFFHLCFKEFLTFHTPHSLLWMWLVLIHVQKIVNSGFVCIYFLFFVL